jgi:hypothetical protein
MGRPIQWSALAIIETGTHRGTTTAFMAETDIPGYTIESDAHSYGFARARCPDYLAPVIAKHKLQAFYPSTSSSEEGGARRGCSSGPCQ